MLLPGGRDFLREKDRSEVARELIDEGKMFNILKRYKKGVLSIEKAAEELDTTIGEFMDLLTELGIKSPVRYEDYKEGQYLRR